MKNLKKMWLMGMGYLLVAVVTCAGFEGSEREKGHKGMGRGKNVGDSRGGEQRGLGKQNAMLYRAINNPKIAKEIGLTEKQVGTLRNSTYELKKELIDLKAKQEKAALEQARLMTAGEIDEEALMRAVEETGEVTTEIAKLKVKHLLFVKKTLTLEQIEKIKEIISERTSRRGDSQKDNAGRDRRKRDWENRRRHREVQEKPENAESDEIQ